MEEHPLSNEVTKISVLGGGAWGTALALHCGRKGHDVLVWAREEDVVKGINEEHENTTFFKVRVCRQAVLMLNGRQCSPCESVLS